jgi:hypothetical protein
MTLWQIWHVRNEVVHDKPSPPLEVSQRFLLSYINSVVQIKHHSGESIIKGKFILDKELKELHTTKVHVAKQIHKWTPPPSGWYKLSIDGSYDVIGKAGAGMVVRDHNGEVIISACRELKSCRGPLEAELHALMEGLSLVLQWCNLPLIIETDCLEVVSTVK